MLRHNANHSAYMRTTQSITSQAVHRMNDIYLQPFVHLALEELEKENFLDNYDYYNNVDSEAFVRIVRQATADRYEKHGVISLKELEALKTKKYVKEELRYLMDGHMPELDQNVIGKKLNQLYKLLCETVYEDEERLERQKIFVDKIRHSIRYKYWREKYPSGPSGLSNKEYQQLTENNLKDCNEIYKECLHSQECLNSSRTGRRTK